MFMLVAAAPAPDVVGDDAARDQTGSDKGGGGGVGPPKDPFVDDDDDDELGTLNSTGMYKDLGPFVFSTKALTCSE